MDLPRARCSHIIEMEVEDCAALWRLLFLPDSDNEMTVAFSLPHKSVCTLFSSEARLEKLQ